jgi:cytidine deaminase
MPYYKLYISKNDLIEAATKTRAAASASCRACRQVLAEFSPKMKIIAGMPKGRVEDLTELLPKPTKEMLESDGNV